MPLTRIDSPQNQTIKLTAKLRTKRGRQEQHRIIIDGTREVSRAIDCGIEVESVFLPVADGNGASSSFGRQVDEWISRYQVYAVSERAFSKLAFGQRQEVVAVAKTPERSLSQLSLPNVPRLIAVLESIEKPGNVGAVMRSADAAGIDAVILVDAVSDLFNPNAIRSSLGTIFSLPLATASFPEYAAWSKTIGFQHLLAKCEQAATPYRDVKIDRDTAIVLGSEAQGLSAVWKNIDDPVNITIPMQGIADSLNISASAAILFFEYQRGTQ